MASEESRKKRFPSPQMRKRLQMTFEAAAKQDSLEKYDYATELYEQCVRGDPGNYDYLQSLMAVLHKRFGSPKKLNPLARFGNRGEKAALKKAIAQCDWDEALQQGFTIILANPWDVSALTQMATACGGILNEEGMTVAVTYGDCELLYLKCAYDVAPRDKPDVDVCIQLAEALKKRDRYQESISFWHKVEVARPDDDLPKREIATLTVLQHQARDPKFEADKKAAAGAKPEELTHEDRLKLRIGRNPKDLAAYDELANLHLNTDDFDKAVEVLQQKLAVTNNDIQVQETIEDVQLKSLRARWIVADAKAKKSGKEADAKEVRSIRATLVERELQTYRNRCERYPNNLAFRFELARRYQLNGNISEAIREFQVAKADPRKRGVSMLCLGDCFVAIKQYSLAMDHYENAIQDIPDRDQDNKKKAYVKAGKLALGLKDFVKARKFLTTLASIDYAYPQISELLERLKRMEEEAAKPKPAEDKKRSKKKRSEDGEEDENEGDEESDE